MFNKGTVVFCTLGLVLTATFGFPAHAHAGFFSSIIKFLTGTGAEASQTPQPAGVSLPLLGSFGFGPPPLGVGGPDTEEELALSATQDSALIGYRSPTGTLPASSADQIVVYTVQPGDAPGSIAESFGISLNTLLWANDIRNPNLIKVGDQLVILPVSGVKYEVKKGDTVASIAKKFKGDAGDILNFNGLAPDESLEVGSTVIIPDGEISAPAAPATRIGSRPNYLPEFEGYYLRPVLGGRKTRGIHGFNGVDLAVQRGSPVLASAPGAVILARGYGWNGGYGKYVVVSHPNSTQTLYSHLDQVLVEVGQQVERGNAIGLVGSTGNSTGPHVHFEIRGARNPF